MKPTDKQIKIIDCIISIVKSWKNTNDISSPTLQSDISEEINSELLEDLSECRLFILQTELERLLLVIQNTKA